MCCLFGMIDYRGHFTGRQKTRLLSVLAAECEARGTDAAGVAYCAGGALRTNVRSLPTRWDSVSRTMFRWSWDIPA